MATLKNAGVAGSRGWAWLGALALTLLAAGLRFHELGTKPIWTDEGYSLAEARLPLPELWNLVPNQLPAFYAVLAGWIRVAGESEAALRLPSAVASASAALALCLIGRELALTRGGLLGAGLFACSPFLIYWAQEAKPEAWMMSIAIWSSYLLLVGWRRGGAVVWAAYAALTVLGLYTFYYYVLTLAGQALAGVLVTVYGRRWHAAAAWTLFQAGLAATLLPWAVPHAEATLAFGHAQSAGAPLNPVQYLVETINGPIGGEPEDDWQSLVQLSARTLLGLLVVAVAVLGVVRLRASPSLFGNVLLVSCLAVPVVGAFILQLAFPLHAARYLIASMPFMLLLAGIGLDQLVRWSTQTRIQALALGLVIVAPWLTLDVNMYGNPRYLHAGWRDAANYYLAHREPGDVIVPDPDWQNTTFDYYLAGDDRSLVLPLDSAPATLNQLHVLRAQGVTGVWTAVAVYAAARDRLGPLVAQVGEPTDDRVNNGYVEIRRYALDESAISCRPTESSTADQSGVSSGSGCA